MPASWPPNRDLAVAASSKAESAHISSSCLWYQQGQERSPLQPEKTTARVSWSRQEEEPLVNRLGDRHLTEVRYTEQASRPIATLREHYIHTYNKTSLLRKEAESKN